MKILSWNLERPNNNPGSIKNIYIVDLIEKINPDIFFLTETNSSIQFQNYFYRHSLALPVIHDGQDYKNGENRVSIFSRFEIENTIETYDVYTAICCGINSPLGALTLYGSIIGSLGGRGQLFDKDLLLQKTEIEKLAKSGRLIYAGDFNISFSGLPYPSKKVVQEMMDFFNLNSLGITTSENNDSAIHIVMSNEILNGRVAKREMIAIDRKISDHNLILLELI
jgi:endonuclease/exonuclease/phosphatase family metal-dependent hydrolase